MTRDLLIESVWQALCFSIPIRRTDYHLFMWTFMDGNKSFQMATIDHEPLGLIEESRYDFIVNIENKKYMHLQKEAQANLDKIADIGRNVAHSERKSGKFKEITLNQSAPDYGLQNGDIIEGWGHII